MDVTRILYAARQIEEREKALQWLHKHGERLAPNDSGVSIKVVLFFAKSCDGATEATTLLESIALAALPDIVQTAIKSCANEIVLHRAAIREEVA